MKSLALLLCLASVAAAAPTDIDTEIALRHFNAGSAAYDSADYARALSEFQTAQKLRPSPAFDFNIGRCYDRLERVPEAIAAYERYVAHEPPDAAEARARIAVLKSRLELPAKASPAPAVVPTPPPTSDGPPRRVATWVVGGTGVALLAGAAVAYVIAHQRNADLSAACNPDGGCDPAKVPDAQSWIDSMHAANIAGDVLLGLGIAAVATGAVLYFVEGRQPAERGAWLTPSIDGHGGGLALVGQW
jgi:tetratricopeptide (TPR) repeat protein